MVEIDNSNLQNALKKPVNNEGMNHMCAFINYFTHIYAYK